MEGEKKQPQTADTSLHDNDFIDDLNKIDRILQNAVQLSHDTTTSIANYQDTEKIRQQLIIYKMLCLVFAGFFGLPCLLFIFYIFYRLFTQ